MNREQVDSSLLARASRKMALVEMDTETIGGNPDLNDPIAAALLQMAIVPVDITNVTDSDIAGVDSSDYMELLDRAEYRLLENIQGNLDLVDVSLGPRRESYSQFNLQLQSRLDRLENKISKLYGGGTLEFGAIAVDDAEKLEDL